MSTKVILPFSSGNSEIVSKGDVIELADGSKFTFIEMKRTKWVGSSEAGKRFNIPVYRDRMQTIPYAKAIVGKNETIVVKTQLNELTPGDLFALENAKQTFMFKETKASKVVGIDIATGNSWTISTTCTFKKIDINELKKSLTSIK